MYLIHDDAGGNGCIEGLYITGHRQGQDEVALFADQPAHAFAFIADDQSHRTREIRLAPDFALHVGAVDPDTSRLQFFHAGGEVRDPGDREIFERTGRGLVHRVVEGGTAALRDDDPVGAGKVCRPDNGAQVMRILDLVKQDKERILSLCGSFFKKLFTYYCRMSIFNYFSFFYLSFYIVKQI